MNLSDAYYDGIRTQIRRVMDLLGDERVDKGLTAFENGHSSWSQCFFARALMPERLNSEFDVAKILDLRNAHNPEKLNLVPVRLVYRTFDGCSSFMTKKELAQFIRDVRNEGKENDRVMAFIRSLDYSGVEDTPVQINSSCISPWVDTKSKLKQ